MPSLFDIGKSGLQAYRQSLAVTGQNIANINTDGYKKRQTALEEVTGAGGGVTEISDQTGLGVRVEDIKRAFGKRLHNRSCSLRIKRPRVRSSIETGTKINPITRANLSY